MQPENRVSANLSPKNIEPISFFDKDADFVFVYKKTEKLASAVYMITSLLSESEPMKWILRKKISELMSFTLGYKDTSESTRIDLSYLIRTKILELVSLLEISLHGGLISKMNFTILKQEFSNVTEALLSSNSSPKDDSKGPIPRSFFEPSLGSNSPFLEAPKQAPNYPALEASPSTAPKEDFKRSNRQNTILTLIRKKKELTIKDIAEVIKDCSEKTIQRELNSFILVGTLKRLGVRRWSRYSLA
ncbi:MAG: hypothetical protein EXS47_01385 [Candidatus Zambryskibacteria bacterium]|nr:hypothetical protein [Candidatus Zambryskibacteria bacterium]